MRRITLLVLMFASVLAYGQKAVKPNLSKALKSFQEGKLDEAKTMIDLATTYEKTKDDGKTWYYRGLIYAALDTTSNATYKALAQEPFKTAVESFKKADELGKKDVEYFINEPNNILPILKSTQLLALANYYLNKGAAQYQEDKLEEALTNFEKTQAVISNDTTAYFYAGFAANSMENYDKAIANFQGYIDKGGKSPDAYSSMINIYSTAKEDKLKALETARKAKEAFPNNSEFPKVEIGILIDLDRVAEAKTGLESAVAKDPSNKIFHFYLGYVNSKLEMFDLAKKNFEDALKIDANYFDAQYYLAQVYYIDADKIRAEMKNLGISAADKKKKADLDKLLVTKYQVALPYWEKAEKLKPSDVDVLDKLNVIYYFLGEDAKSARVSKLLKELGADK